MLSRLFARSTSKRSVAASIYYFDIVAWAIGLAIVRGSLALPIRRGSLGASEGLLALVLFCLALVALTIFRRQAYTQRLPWLTLTFSAFAFVILLIVFWRWSLMWFIAAAGAGATMFTFGLIVRTKAISDPFTRDDLFKLVLVAVSSSFALGLAEATLRLMPGLINEEIQQVLRADPRQYGVAHPYIGHLQRPNGAVIISGRDFKAVHHTDANGFRNKSPWPESAEIVVLGDSVVFGYGVADEQAWPAVLARSLPGSSLMNLGLIGATPQQYLRVHETFGMKLRPKLLLVGVLVQNDFWDAGMFDRWVRSGVGGNFLVWRDFGRPGRLRFSWRQPIASVDGILRAKLYPVVRRSYFFNLLRVIRGESEGDLLVPARIFSFADGSRLRLQPGQFFSNTALGRPQHREFQLTLEALQRICSIATKNGAHTLIVLQPGKEEVYLPLLGEPIAEPTISLRRAFDRLGIDYLDLAPGFRQRAAAGQRLFFEVDGHPNATGYALIAELVLAHLEHNLSRYGLDDSALQKSR